MKLTLTLLMLALLRLQCSAQDVKVREEAVHMLERADALSTSPDLLTWNVWTHFACSMPKLGCGSAALAAWSFRAQDGAMNTRSAVSIC